MWVNHVIEWPRFLQTSRRQGRERIPGLQAEQHSVGAPSTLNFKVLTWKPLTGSFPLRKQHQQPGLPVYSWSHLFLNSWRDLFKHLNYSSIFIDFDHGWLTDSAGSGLVSQSVHQWRVWWWTPTDFRQLILLASYYLSAHFLSNVAVVFTAQSALFFCYKLCSRWHGSM